MDKKHRSILKLCTTVNHSSLISTSWMTTKFVRLSLITTVTVTRIKSEHLHQTSCRWEDQITRKPWAVERIGILMSQMNWQSMVEKLSTPTLMLPASWETKKWYVSRYLWMMPQWFKTRTCNSWLANSRKTKEEWESIHQTSQEALMHPIATILLISVAQTNSMPWQCSRDRTIRPLSETFARGFKCSSKALKIYLRCSTSVMILIFLRTTTALWSLNLRPLPPILKL